jgi:hypothetical protein
MRNTSNLVPLSEEDPIPEVVLHNPEVVAMVLDIGREIPAVTPANDLLLAAVWSLPVHFEDELVRLD